MGCVSPSAQGQAPEQFSAQRGVEPRKLVTQSDDRDGALEFVEDRTNDLYNAEVPEEMQGWVRGPVAGEFFAIGSGRKMPVRIAVEDFLSKANLKPSTKSLYKGLLRQLGGEFAFLEGYEPQVRAQFPSVLLRWANQEGHLQSDHGVTVAAALPRAGPQRI